VVPGHRPWIRTKSRPGRADPDPCNVAVEGVGPYSEGTVLKPELDTTRPSIARVYDYWLDGKDNFAADRGMADEMERCYPGTRQMVVSNRQFLVRAVTWAADQGISQFLDLGAGCPR